MYYIYVYYIYVYAPSPKQEDPSQKTQVNRLAEVSSFPMVCLCFLFITRWILVLGTFLPTTFCCITAKVTPTTQTSLKWPYFLGGVSLVTRCWLTSQHLTETPRLCRNPKKQRHLEHASLERYHRGTPGEELQGGLPRHHVRVFLVVVFDGVLKDTFLD